MEHILNASRHEISSPLIGLNSWLLISTTAFRTYGLIPLSLTSHVLSFSHSVTLSHSCWLTGWSLPNLFSLPLPLLDLDISVPLCCVDSFSLKPALHDSLMLHTDTDAGHGRWHQICTEGSQSAAVWGRMHFFPCTEVVVLLIQHINQ